jgi:hypothetical protein
MTTAIRIQLELVRPIEFSKNGFDLLVGYISVIFSGVGLFHVVRYVGLYVDSFYICLWDCR